MNSARQIYRYLVWIMIFDENKFCQNITNKLKTIRMLFLLTTKKMEHIHKYINRNGDRRRSFRHFRIKCVKASQSAIQPSSSISFQSNSTIQCCSCSFCFGFHAMCLRSFSDFSCCRWIAYAHTHTHHTDHRIN